MSTPIVYPATLPVPQSAPIQSTERRAIAPPGGPYDVRALQRDKHAEQQITLPPLNAADTAIFEAWWENDLVFGGAWFEATWPLPEGLVPAARRMLATPHYEFLPTPQGNYWRISFPCEVKGRGEAPEVHECLDGPSWSETSRESYIAFHIAYLNGRFVVSLRDKVGGAGTGAVMYSTNGRDWSVPVQIPITYTFSPTQVAYGNGIYVAMTDSTLDTAQSSDLITWTDGTSNPNVKKAGTFGMWFGGGLFVQCAAAPSAMEVLASANASGQVGHATPVYFNTGNYIQGLHFGCDTDGGDIYSSPDLVTWTLRGTTTFVSGFTQTKRLIGDGNGTLIAIDGRTQRNFVSVSHDLGFTWGNSTGLPVGDVFYVDLLYLTDRAMWMLTDNTGVVYLSRDSGDSWTAAASNLSSFLPGAQNWYMAARPDGFLYAAIPVTAEPSTVAAVGDC